MLLEQISSPADVRELSYEQLTTLASEIRTFIVNAVSVTGGHLGSNLGVVELTFALHRVFDSPRDILLWDTGHQAYVHKILTGRREGFSQLRQAGGLSGYPSRAESEHDWVENSHASTILSYAHGVATSMHLSGADDRRVVAVIGDGSMTGGMAYEALNNLGHSGRRVLIVLNDNGRSYAPTISRLSTSVTRLRSSPSYVRRRRQAEGVLREVPVIGEYLEASVQGLRAAFREVLGPKNFFEALGVRYVGPVDGHNVAEMEHVLRQAAAFDGPIVVHLLTRKGKGYPFAEDDDEKCLHDAPVFDPLTGPPAWVPIENAWEYDPATDNWRALAPLPTKRGSPVAVSAGDKIYVIGGATVLPGASAVHPAQPHYSVGAVEEYDPATNSWRSRAALPTPRNHAVGAAVNGKIYVIGGRVGGAFVSSGSSNVGVVEEYDPAADRWGAPRARMPSARSAMAAGVYQGRIYVTGGEGQDYRSMFTWRALEAYDPATNTWSTLPSLPVSRHGLAGATVGNRLHMVSGDVQSAGTGVQVHTADHDAYEFGK